MVEILTLLLKDLQYKDKNISTMENKQELGFDELIKKRVQETVLKQIGDCRYVEYHHSQKKSIPSDVLNKAWDSIDWDKVIGFVTKELQDKVCQTIVQNMLTEVKTDVKSILSIEGMRQKIRAEVYPKIKEVIGL